MYSVLLLAPMQSKIGALHVKVGRIPIRGDKISFAVSEDGSDKKALYVSEVEEVVMCDELSRGPHNEAEEQTKALAYIKRPILFSLFSRDINAHR